MMKKRPSTLLFLLTAFALSAAEVPLTVGGGSLRTTQPASLAFSVQGQTLKVDPPEIATHRAEHEKPPGDFREDFPKLKGWWFAKKFGPSHDANGTPVLGGFFRSVRADTVVVKSADGTVYQRDADYKFNPEMGEIAAIDGRIQGPVILEAEIAKQRLDLLQLDPVNGTYSVKKGESVWVCPVLPEADPGRLAVAGLYIAPWRTADHPEAAEAETEGADEYALTAKDVFPIRPSEPSPAEPPLPELAGIRGKLAAGETVTLAFVGDSIVLGAESTRWWEDKYDEKSKTWKGRVVYGLKQAYPDAEIKVIESYQGGRDIREYRDKMEGLMEQGADLVLIAFGANDADGFLDKPPKVPVDQFTESLQLMTGRVKKAGGEVMLLTPIPLNPWLGNQLEQRLETLYAPAIRKAAASEGAALADVRKAGFALENRGIPPWSQLHNWVNHPGNLGHEVYAGTVLRLLLPKE